MMSVLNNNLLLLRKLLFYCRIIWIESKLTATHLALVNFSTAYL